MEETRTRLQRAVLIAMAAMIVGYGLLTAASHLFFRGVAFEGDLLRPESSAEGAVYTGKVHGDAVTVAVTRESGNAATVTYTIGGWLHDVCRVEYPLPPIQTERGRPVDGIRVWKNDRLLFEGGWNAEEPYGWYDASGAWDPMQTLSFGVSGGSGDPWGNYETTAADALRFARGPELTARGSWALYGMLVFLSALVMLDAAFPMTLFRLRHCCDVRDPEPSEFYRSMQRLGWAVYPCLLLIGYTMALWQLP